MDRLESLIARQQIFDLLHCYCSALDTRDWRRLASCFLPGAVAVYGEDLGRQDGYAAIEQPCRSALGPLDSSHHMISNQEIEIDGDTARSRCYLHAQHTKAGTPGGDNLAIGGMYVDELVRTAEGWRIRFRELRFLWQEGNPAVIAADPLPERA